MYVDFRTNLLKIFIYSFGMAKGQSESVASPSAESADLNFGALSDHVVHVYSALVKIFEEC
jgi:hypothetical protein